MFFRLKKSGERAYVQIVENKRVDGAVRQSVIATLGRADELDASGALASLLASGAKLTDQVLLINALDEDADGALSASAKRIGGPLLFGKIWERLGDRRCPWRSVAGSRLRVRGGARGVRRHAAPHLRLGLGPRLFILDGGLRHCRLGWAGPASFLSRHGLARRGDGGEKRRRARATLRQGRDRREAVRQAPRSLCRSLRRVHGYDQPFVLWRRRRDAGRAWLLQGLSPRSEADDLGADRRWKWATNLHRDVAGQYRRRHHAAAGRSIGCANASPSDGSASSPIAA